MRTEGLPAFGLGYARSELRRQLVDAVLRGEKTATAGLADKFEREGHPLPQPGDRSILRDFDDVAVAIVEITQSDLVPARDIDLQFARDEGEGFESIEDWRRAHEAFFEQPIDDGTLIVAQLFRLVEHL